MPTRNGYSASDVGIFEKFVKSVIDEKLLIFGCTDSEESTSKRARNTKDWDGKVYSKNTVLVKVSKNTVNSAFELEGQIQ